MGELFTRSTIYVALTCYFLATALKLKARPTDRTDDLARWLWTAGLLFYLTHVAAAFQSFHDWSHWNALEFTANKTAELIGPRWGGGLYFNYAFTMLWCVDVLWWWRGLGAYRSRPASISIFVQVFLGIIVLNATIVFEHGPVRWLSAIAFVALGLLWIRNQITEQARSSRTT